MVNTVNIDRLFYRIIVLIKIYTLKPEALFHIVFHQKQNPTIVPCLLAFCIMSSSFFPKSATALSSVLSRIV